MKILVIQKHVPDIVEELVITPDGRDLDEREVRYVLNEMDQHALEQALILKERHGARVDVLAIGGEEAVSSLAEAVAKGVDGILRLAAQSSDRRDNHSLSVRIARFLEGRRYDLVLTGVQAVDDLNGTLGGYLAARLHLPYIGGLAAVACDPSRNTAKVMKEFPGGVLAALEVSLPAVLGIQSAERPPRYVPVSRIMQARKGLKYEEVPAAPVDEKGLSVRLLTKPTIRARAEMLQGDAEAVADRIATLLKERGLL